MTMNLKPTIRFQLRDYFTIALIILLVNIFLVAGSFIGIYGFEGEGEIYFTGFGLSAMLFLFIYGIVSPRPAMRMNIQLGISRRTTFLANLLSAAITALALAVSGEIFMTTGQFLTHKSTAIDFYFGDLFTQLYLGFDQNALSMTPGQHGTSILFSLCLMVFAWTVGCFFTFLFWRLKKSGYFITAVVILLLVNGMPIALYHYAPSGLMELFQAINHLAASSPWFVMLLFLLFTAMVSAINWLLVRGTNIRGTSLK